MVDPDLPAAEGVEVFGAGEAARFHLPVELGGQILVVPVGADDAPLADGEHRRAPRDLRAGPAGVEVDALVDPVAIGARRAGQLSGELGEAGARDGHGERPDADVGRVHRRDGRGRRRVRSGIGGAGGSQAASSAQTAESAQKRRGAGALRWFVRGGLPERAAASAVSLGRADRRPIGGRLGRRRGLDGRCGLLVGGGAVVRLDFRLGAGPRRPARRPRHRAARGSWAGCRLIRCETSSDGRSSGWAGIGRRRSGRVGLLCIRIGAGFYDGHGDAGRARAPHGRAAQVRRRRPPRPAAPPR